MSKSSKKKQATKREVQQLTAEPWIQMKTGLILVAIASVVMAVLTAIQVIPEKGVLEGIGWGLLFGVLIWAIFWGYYFFYRFIRRTSR